MKRYDCVWDIEADSLNPTRIWMAVFKVIGSDKWRVVRTREELLALIPKLNLVVAHNSFGFDLPVIRKLWDIPFNIEPDLWNDSPVEFVDSFHLSSYLNPDYPGGHSLENLASGTGEEKMNFRQACIEDGVITADAPEGAEFQQEIRNVI